LRSKALKALNREGRKGIAKSAKKTEQLREQFFTAEPESSILPTASCDTIEDIFRGLTAH
jgi:hypothetical protein